MEKNAKQLLSEHCQQEKIPYALYECNPDKEGQRNGFFCTIKIGDKSFTIPQYEKSKKAAEMSAAKMACSQMNITQSSVATKKVKPRKHMPPPKYPFFRLLCQCAGNLKLQYPILMHKVDSSGEISLYTVALQFEGKIFKSKTPATTLFTGREEASVEAIKYLGVADPEEASTLKQSILIPIRYRRKFSLMTYFASPLAFSPSKRTGWVFEHRERVDEMTGNEFVIGDDEKILRIRPSSTQDVNEIFDRAMKVDPRFNGSLLSECGDIVIAEVNKSNKSSTIVGNQNFSIQMFAENGKILSTTKGSLVDLLPGQNIRGLKCSYQLMYPSLQVYLKAESCTDVTKPRKLLPVVTSCGVAILIYDHEAHIQDLNILLTRPSRKLTFVSISNYVKIYLNGAINSANTSSTFTVARCVKNIATWTAKEVQLMSEMTVESMKELLSHYVRYDERWSELFEEKQTDVLKELKGAAVAELSRRKAGGVVDVKVEEEWRLPATAFQHTLCNYGVYMENDMRCAFRSVAQITGTKVKLADLEESPIVDVPVNSANNGAVCRYYVWKGIRKVSGDEQEPYYNVPTDVTAELGEGWLVTAGKSDNPTETGDETRSHNRLLDLYRVTSHKKRHLHDNDIDNGVSEPKKGNTELDEDITDVAKPADEEGKVPMKPDATSFNKPVHMECRWVPLEEAKKICPILKTIASKTPFKAQVIALQHDVNNFVKEKQVKQEAV